MSEIYYTRNGKPLMQVVRKNSRNQTIATINPMIDGDIPITKEEYDSLMVQNENAASQLRKDSINLAGRYRKQRQANISTATTKLEALGLTAEEIAAILY